ncbi:MAG: hypothetical protein AB1797_03655 [bacterium]
MRKFLILLLILGTVFICGLKRAEAATTDTFQITITVNYISINLLNQAGADYGTWAIGQVATSTASTMDSNNGGVGDEGIQVDNTSNVAIDIESYVSNTDGWTLGAAIGADQFTLAAKAFTAWQAGPTPNMTGAVSITQTAGPGADITTNLAANTDTYLYYTLTAPSSVTSGAQKTLTVTVDATAF